MESKHIILPKPYEWQKAVLDEICNKANTGKKVVVKSRRQCGKTFLIQSVLIHYALHYKKSVNALIEPVNAQARRVFRNIKNALWETGVITKANETFLEIEFINGSRIMFKSAESGDSLRGYTVSGILCLDEAAFLSPDTLELVLPWLNVHTAPMLIVSTPKIRDGIFYNFWKEGLDETNRKVVSIDWCDYDTSALLSEDVIAQYRKILTKNQFKSEILGEFLDDEGLVFSYFKENLIPEIIDTTAKGFFVGIDFGAGNGGDYTAISVFNNEGKMVFLDYFNDLSTFQQIDRLANDILKFGNSIQKMNAENNSIGSPMIDLLIQELNKRGYPVLVSKINRWITTNKSKSELVQQMQVALEQGKTKLFDNKMLVNQFGAYEAQYNPKTQVVTYNGAVGTNDDIVMATMLAWDAYYKNNIGGMYSVSVV